MSLLEIQGILQINGKNAINTKASPAEAAAKAALMNSGDYLWRAFFNPENFMEPHHQKPDNGGILYTMNSTDGTVNLFIPSGPYAERAVMIVAGNEQDLLTRPTDVIETQTIYHFGDEAQFHYWNMGLMSLQAFHANLPEGSHDIFIGENCLRYRTGEIDIRPGEKVRTSRSIALPHLHVIPLPKHAIDTSTQVSFDHLSREQEALREPKFAEFVQSVTNALSMRTRELIGTLLPHNDAPVGYTFTFPGNLGTDLFRQVMEEHHQAFSKVAPKLGSFLPEHFRTFENIPMPSYRLYIAMTQHGDMQCIISPEIISCAGVMEAAGVGLLRSPEIPKQLNVLEEIEYRAMLCDTLRNRN